MKVKKPKYNIAIVGATGAVGEQMREVLEERKFPVGEMRLLASERSAGQFLEFDGHQQRVGVLNESSFQEIDIALFSAGGSVSAKYAPLAVSAGAVVIDNTACFRMAPDIPLVVPEVNASAIGDYKNRGIIANPNCPLSRWWLLLNRFTMPRASSAWWFRLINRYRAPAGKRWRN